MPGALLITARLVGVVATLALVACTPSADKVTSEPTAQTGFGGKPSEAAAAREVDGSYLFMMPSGNIGCHLDPEFARCDIGAKSWEPPPKPDDCELDWGSGLVVDAEDVTFGCSGDTVLGGSEVLPYGDAVRSGDFICESASANVRCRHEPTGHGFTLARERYTTF